jgi:hypothetical protein
VTGRSVAAAGSSSSLPLATPRYDGQESITGLSRSRDAFTLEVPMTNRIASCSAVLVPLLFFLSTGAALGQLVLPAPRNISISVDPTNPRLSTLVATRTDGSFEANGQVVNLTQTETRLIVEMVTGNYTWTQAGRPPSTKAFKTLQLTFENPRGNMIGFRVSYD